MQLPRFKLIRTISMGQSEHGPIVQVEGVYWSCATAEKMMAKLQENPELTRTPGISYSIETM